MSFAEPEPPQPRYPRRSNRATTSAVTLEQLVSVDDEEGEYNSHHDEEFLPGDDADDEDEWSDFYQ